ncbi:transcriptional regulator, LysR family [Rhizobiales bacterium GAS188]|nr:transcriptional regulator, LysR family [Rhizobiales bacterium GAS188]
MTDFRSLETFVWVATLGSFRGAAAKLNTTQPAVSQRIAKLELDLGLKLIERQSRSAHPTEKGRELLSYAERLLKLRSEMRAALADRNAVRGVLRLGVSETIVHTWLPRFIERVHATHPRLALEIDVDISPNLRNRLVAQEIDLAFLLGPLSSPTIRNRALCRFPLAFLASPKLDLPQGPVSLGALARHPIITFSRGTQPYVAVNGMFSQPHLPPIRLHASASLAPVVRMAVDGIGIAVIPPAIVADELKAGRLRIVEADAVIPDLGFTASWPMTPDGFAAEQLADIGVAIAQEDQQRRLVHLLPSEEAGEGKRTSKTPTIRRTYRQRS